MFEGDTLKNLLLAILLFVSGSASASAFFFTALGDTAYYGESDQAVYRALIKLINEIEPSSRFMLEIYGMLKNVLEKDTR